MVRHALAVLIASILALSAVGTGHARGLMPPVGSVTICAAHGVVRLFVAQDGTPIEVTVLCPDCLAKAQVPHGTTAPDLAQRLVLHAVVRRGGALLRATPGGRWRPEARAPPPGPSA